MAAAGSTVGSAVGRPMSSGRHEFCLVPGWIGLRLPQNLGQLGWHWDKSKYQGLQMMDLLPGMQISVAPTGSLRGFLSSCSLGEFLGEQDWPSTTADMG